MFEVREKGSVLNHSQSITASGTYGDIRYIAHFHLKIRSIRKSDECDKKNTTWMMKLDSRRPRNLPTVTIREPFVCFTVRGG